MISPIHNLLLRICLLLLFTQSSASEPKCGGKLKSKFGVIVTPNFPGRFPVPITCKWVIESTSPEKDRQRRSLLRFRRNPRPGLFVNEVFDTAFEIENRTRPTPGGIRRANSTGTKRLLHRKQVKLKPTGGPQGMLMRPSSSPRVTPSSHIHLRTVAPIITNETSGDSDLIVVYLTQLYVTTGLVIKEYAYYEDDSMKYAENVIFSANDKNVLTDLVVTTERPYLVIEFGLDRLDTNHVRALDSLLDVYGFNMTYDVIKSRELSGVNSCSVANCSYNGQCFASANFR